MIPPVPFDGEPGPFDGSVHTNGVKEQPIDPIQKASHYNWHPSGVECFDIVRHFNFCKGGAIKYLWRAGRKGDGVKDELKDLKQARRLIDEEINRVEAGEVDRCPVAAQVGVSGRLTLPNDWFWHDYDKPEIKRPDTLAGVARVDGQIKQIGVVPSEVVCVFWNRVHDIDCAEADRLAAEDGAG